MKEKVKLREKIGFLCFSMSTNIVYNFKSMYYLTFLTMVLQIDVALAGIMMTIGTIWDAVNDPLIAVFCANHQFKSGEKVRPYALYCCIPWAITIVLLFTNLNVSQTWAIILGEIIYFVFEAIYTFLCMPYNSMASLATTDEEERKSINSFRSLGGCVGTAIGAVAILPIVKLFGGLTDHKIINITDAPALFKTAITMGVICALGSLAHYFTSKERVHEIESEEAQQSISLLDAYKRLFKCKSWVRNMLLIFFYGIANTMMLQNINNYASYILGDSNAATPVLAVYLVFSIIAASVAPKFDQIFGRKKALSYAALLTIIGKIPFIINPYSMVTIYINAITDAIGMPTIFILFNTNRNVIADILTAQNHRRLDTLVAGGDSLISKLGQALAIQVMTATYALTGYKESLGANQTIATKNAINCTLGIVPSIVLAIVIYFANTMDMHKELQESQQQ